MNIKSFVVICMLLLAAFACKETGYPKPENLVSEKQMVDMLYDIHLNESYLNAHKYDEDTLDFTSMDLHFSVLEKYGVADSTFYKSVLYYSTYPKRYAKIYQQVVDRLVMQEEELNKKEAVKVKTE